MNSSTDWLANQAKTYRNKTAVVTGSRTYSFEELDKAVNYFASYFKAAGINANHEVPLLVNNNIEFIISLYALWRMDCIPVPISPLLPVPELDSVMQILKPEYCIKESSIVYTFEDTQFVNIPGISFADNLSVDKWGIKDEALILFTSGSSGKQKGVVLGFSSLYKSYKNINSFDNYISDDRFLASLPFYHIGGLSIIIRSLLSGSQLILPKSTDYKGLAEGMQIFNPTIISIVPTNLQRLLENNIQPNKALRSLYLGGGPSSQNLVEQAVNAGYPLIKVYGSTETCSMVTAVRVSKPEEYSSSGRTIGDSRILIDYEDIQTGSSKGIGEILVYSSSLFSSYYNNHSLTSSKLVSGYYRTGDFGYVDKSGLLFVTMRRSDLIVSGGENVNPEEVRSELLNISGIKDCYVAGIEDSQWGQKVIAFITGNSLPGDDLIKSVLKTRIAPYKIPKIFYRIDRIPRNSLGKVLRRELFLSLKKDSPKDNF